MCFGRISCVLRATGKISSPILVSVEGSGLRVQYEHGDGNTGSSMQRAKISGYFMGFVFRDIFLGTAILNPEP
jgi:hypothetical protein